MPGIVSLVPRKLLSLRDGPGSATLDHKDAMAGIRKLEREHDAHRSRTDDDHVGSQGRAPREIPAARIMIGAGRVRRGAWPSRWQRRARA